MAQKEYFLTVTKFSEFQYQGLLMDDKGETIKSDLIAGTPEEVKTKAEAHVNTLKNKGIVSDISNMDAAERMINAKKTPINGKGNPMEEESEVEND